LLVGTKIGTKAINLGPNETFLGEFHSISSGDSLNFTLGVESGVNFNSTLGSTEWNISDGEFEGHKGSQSHNLLNIHGRGIAGATFDGELVMLVLSTVTEDLLHGSVVTLDWDSESDNVVADLDHVEVVLGNVSLLGSTFEEKVNLFEETGFLSFVGNWTSLLVELADAESGHLCALDATEGSNCLR